MKTRGVSLLALAALAAIPSMVATQGAPYPIIVVAIYIGAMIWTVRLAFSSSKMLPVFDFVGLQQFERLFATERFVASGWHILVFGVLFIAGALVLGFLLAVFIDQHVRFEGAFRTIFLYPYAMSFIVTGLAWQWFLHPELGLQKAVRDWGFTSFTFDWIVQPNLVILCVRIDDADGFQVLSMLKLDEDTRGIPVLTYTTEYEGKDTEDEIPEPADAEIFGTKPAVWMN